MNVSKSNFTRAIIFFSLIVTFRHLDAQSEIYIQSLAWHPTEEILAVGTVLGNQPHLYLYHGSQTPIGEINVTGRIVSLAWSPDGTKLAGVVGETEDTLYIWSTDTYIVATTIPQEGGTSTYNIAWSSDSRYLASVRTSLNVWDVSNGQSVATFQEENDNRSVEAFDWYNDGIHLAISTSNNEVIIWRRDTNVITQQVPTGALTTSLMLNYDNLLLALGKSDGNVQIVDATDISRTIDNFQVAQEALYQINWASDDDQVLVAGSNSDITLWNILSGENIDTIPKQTYGFLQAFAYSPFYGRLAYSTNPLSVAAPTLLSESPANTSLSVQTSLVDGAVQIVVPDPSLERLEAIAAACNAPTSLIQPLAAQTSALADEAVPVAALDTFVAQLDALPTDTIPPGCAADLRAVAGAIGANLE